MRTVKIAADSSCDLFHLEHADFASAPMKVITAEREFVDNADLDADGMTAYLEGYKGKSKSSCPNTTDWLNAFGGADDVFCVTITSKLSGSCNSAMAAKEIYESEHTGRRVFVIDTLSAGPEITLLVRKIEEYVKSGIDYDEICQRIREYREKTGLLFMLKSLRNFANNGRVSPVVAKLVGVAGICIVGRASDEGTLEPMHKCRGEQRSLRMITEELAKRGFSSGKVSIGHCMNEEAALRLRGMILMKFPDADVEIHALRGLCSFYAEKGGVLVGFEKG